MEFSGRNSGECLKNKVSTMFALTANNVDDMSQFIKDIPIPA